MAGTARMIMVVFLLAIPSGTMASTDYASADIRGFIYDGCTFFPEGTPNNPKLWDECCLEHDLYLWAGGTRPAHDRADLRLRDCVTEKGAPRIAKLMYAGVRAGRHSPIRLKGKHWGNAWSDHFVHRHLTLQEIQLIEEAVPDAKLPEELEARFLKTLYEDLNHD